MNASAPDPSPILTLISDTVERTGETTDMLVLSSFHTEDDYNAIVGASDQRTLHNWNAAVAADVSDANAAGVAVAVVHLSAADYFAYLDGRENTPQERSQYAHTAANEAPGDVQFYGGSPPPRLAIGKGSPDDDSFWVGNLRSPFLLVHVEPGTFEIAGSVQAVATVWPAEFQGDTAEPSALVSSLVAAGLKAEPIFGSEFRTAVDPALVPPVHLLVQNLEVEGGYWGVIRTAEPKAIARGQNGTTIGFTRIDWLDDPGEHARSLVKGMLAYASDYADKDGGWQ